MRKFIAGLFAAVMFTLTACGVNVDAGTVSDKRTDEVEITEQQCETETEYKTVNGKRKSYQDTDCEDVGTGEFETKYYITLQDKDKNDEEHEVSEDVYNSLEVGDFYDTEA